MAKEGQAAVSHLACVAILHTRESFEPGHQLVIALPRHSRGQATIARGGFPLQSLGHGEQILRGTHPNFDLAGIAHLLSPGS